MCQVPGQEVVDPADGVVRYVFEDLVQIDLRVETVELGGAEQGLDGCGAFSAGVGACEEEILASERDDAQRAFSGVVVDLELSIIDIAGQRTPARERVADRGGGVGLPGELAERGLKPDAEFVEQRLRPGLPGG
jgi:hypothetical protein